RGFVERLREEAEGEAPEAPIVEEASEGVRIMTVHKAKGLEFPVVILADITAGLAGTPGRFAAPGRHRGRHRRQSRPLRGSGAGALRAAAGWLAAVGSHRARERRDGAGPGGGCARALLRCDAGA